MHREFGDEGQKILSNLYEEIGISDILMSDLDQKKEFVASMIPMFRTQKSGRSGVLTSELMSVIGLQVKGQSGITPKLDKEIVRSFVGVEGGMRLKVINAKIGSMYNLFWEKAGVAFEVGVDPKIIDQMTGRVLYTVKQDLYGIVGELEERFNLSTARNKMMSKAATSKSRKDEFSFSRKNLSSRQQMEDILEPIFKEFKESIDKNYADFYTVFIGSINKDIELRQQGKFDTELMPKAKEETKEIWDRILLSFDKLRKEVETIPSIDDMKNSDGKSNDIFESEM